jgi:hypothetical protein
MFDYADDDGRREVYEPLAEELARQMANLATIRQSEETRAVGVLEGLDTSALDWAAHVMDERTEEGRKEHHESA